MYRVSARHSYDGPALDATGQHITESPVWGDDGETVGVTPEDAGEVRTEGEIVLEDDRVERPDVDGQSTWADWTGDSA